MTREESPMVLGAAEALTLLNSIKDKKFLAQDGTQKIIDFIKTKLDAPTTDGSTGDVLVLNGELKPEWKDIELTKYVTGAKYNSTGTGHDGKPCIELINTTSGTESVIAHIPAEPFLKDSFLKTVEITDGTGSNNGKKVLKFTWDTVEKGDSERPTTTEIPLDDIFNPGLYLKKEDILDILYGSKTGTEDTATDKSLVGRIKELERWKATVKFEKNGDSTTTIKINIDGTSYTVLLDGALDDLNKRVGDIEKAEVQELTAAEVEAMIKGTTSTDDDDDDDNQAV